MTDTPRGPTTEAPAMKAWRCEQCGRIGTRGFQWLRVFGSDHIIQCASRSACQKRYERQRPRWLDE